MLPASRSAPKKILSDLATRIDCCDLKRETEGRFGVQTRCEQDANDSGGWKETSVLLSEDFRNKTIYSESPDRNDRRITASLEVRDLSYMS